MGNLLFGGNRKVSISVVLSVLLRISLRLYPAIFTNVEYISEEALEWSDDNKNISKKIFQIISIHYEQRSTKETDVNFLQFCHHLQSLLLLFLTDLRFSDKYYAFILT